MGQTLQVAIAHQNAEARNTLHAGVSQLGHAVCFHAGTGRELIESARTRRPDLVVVQEYLPDMDGLQAATEAARGDAIPTIVVVATHDGALVERRDSENVLAILREPVRQSDLTPVLPLVMNRFSQLQELRNEIESLQWELDTGE